MLRDVIQLARLIAVESAEARRRVVRQSALALRIRRAYRRRRQRWRRWLDGTHTTAGEDGFCVWVPRVSRYGRPYWACQLCGGKTLHPSSGWLQRRRGLRCPAAGGKSNEDGKRIAT